VHPLIARSSKEGEKGEMSNGFIYFVENGETEDPDGVSGFREVSWLPRYRRVLARHYSRCSLEEVEELQPLAVILGGSGTPWEQFIKKDWIREFEIIKHASVSILGICGGHQIIGMAYHEPIRELGCSPIRRLRPGEEDKNVGTHLEGYFMERGYLPVKILKRDPLFEGLGDTIVVDEGHYCEIKELPPEFDLLASTEECRIQAIKHKQRPVYGVQFHPNKYDEEHPDGKKILENFLKIAER